MRTTLTLGQFVGACMGGCCPNILYHKFTKSPNGVFWLFKGRPNNIAPRCVLKSAIQSLCISAYCFQLIGVAQDLHHQGPAQMLWERATYDLPPLCHQRLTRGRCQFIQISSHTPLRTIISYRAEPDTLRAQIHTGLRRTRSPVERARKAGSLG